jgi:dolichyl-diphosphooligosaccharide--protein glycosyltransferase
LAKHSEHHESTESREEVSLDFSKIKRFFSSSNLKRNTYLLTILLLIIPIAFTIYIRLQPQYLPQTDTWAENSVNNYFRTQIANAVNSQYPNLPAQNKETLINQQYADFQKNNKDMIAQQITATSNYFKTGFQYKENNYTYTFLGDLDSYFFLRYTRNIIEKGSYCDEIREGKCFDNHMYAPLGTEIGASMHPYGIYYLYKFLHMLDARVNPMQAAFYLPTFLAVFAAIAAFFVGKKMMNATAGFFASMFLALSPMFLSRTLGSDTDIWNIMFVLIALWIFLEAFEAKLLRNKIILSAIVGMVFALFNFAWGGWWYIFDFMLATLVIYILFTILRNLIATKNFKKSFNQEVVFAVIILGVLVLSSFAFVSLTSSTNSFTNAFTEPLIRLTISQEAAKANYWPNILTTVAEMNDAGIDSIVSQTAFGINLFFALALLGVVFTMVRKKPTGKEYLFIAGSAIIFLFLVSKSAFALNSYLYLLFLMAPMIIIIAFLLFDKSHSEKGLDIDIKPAILLTIWFVGMILASTKGVRFILMVIPAFAVAIGVALGYLHQYIAGMLKSEFKISEKITKPAIFILLCFLLVTPVRAGIATGNSFTPSMTLGWWDTLTKIKAESQPDAIINSWWDFGHWFKYAADRRVTVDGSGQHYQLAHWMGTVLVTTNEDQAINTLRMLDCGSFESYELVYAQLNDVLKSVAIEKRIIMQSETDAKITLQQAGIPAAAADEILAHVFCNPPENYLITSEDMVGKAGVWAHFGLWDFNKAYMIREVKPKSPDEGIAILKDKFKYSDNEATTLYYELQALQSDSEINNWISPWPNYLTGQWTSCKIIKPQLNNTGASVNGTETADEANSKGVMMCTIGAEINRNNQARTIIEGAVLDLNDYKNASLVIGSYDLASNYKLGSGRIVPSAFVLFKEGGIEKVDMENSTFPYDVLIDMVENRTMITDSRLSQSLFTKLFYLDGRYTTHFEKFSETTDMTGTMISVWKVKWD